MENYLIVGLGNIGPEYSSTRHNAGFMTLDAWAQASNVHFQTQKHGDLALVSVKGKNFYLLKPSTYMNLSGIAVRYWLGKLPVTVEHLAIICDDLNLPFGQLRMRKSGSDGGHNGLKNIIECIETSQFTRLRIGIGHNFAAGAQCDFVLGELSPEEKEQMATICEKAVKGIQTWAFCGAERAMNDINKKLAEDLDIK